MQEIRAHTDEFPREWFPKREIRTHMDEFQSEWFPTHETPDVCSECHAVLSFLEWEIADERNRPPSDEKNTRSPICETLVEVRAWFQTHGFRECTDFEWMGLGVRTG